MKDADRQTRAYLMDVFQERGFHPRTDLGQNFLIDLNLLEYIVQAAELSPNDVVLEIGTGTGGMTAAMAREAGDVVSVEIDHRVFGLAQEAVGKLSNVTLLNIDALKTKSKFAPEVIQVLAEKLSESPQRRLKLVANLPYSVGTPIISNLVASELPWRMMVVTIQLELAQRMRAKPKTSDYSALSVVLQAQCFIKILKKLRPNVFWPRPGVDSAIVRLIPDARRKALIQDRRFFQDFIRRLFHQRRKSVRNVIVGMYRQQLLKSEIDDVFAAQQLPDGVRAEALEVPKLVELANAMHTLLQTKAPIADKLTKAQQRRAARAAAEREASDAHPESDDEPSAADQDVGDQLETERRDTDTDADEADFDEVGESSADEIVLQIPPRADEGDLAAAAAGAADLDEDDTVEEWDAGPDEADDSGR